MRKYGMWVVTGFCALAFAAAGAAKLAGQPMVHKSFADLGLPVWFGYFIGACEVAGAIGLLIGPLRNLAALGLAVILCGALYYHLTFPPLSAGLPALILLLLCAIILIPRGGRPA